MTDFINGLNKPTVEVKERKTTEFHKYITRNSVATAHQKPSSYKHVKLIGRDEVDGDVFQAWNANPSRFTIYFGNAGDEFGEL